MVLDDFRNNLLGQAILGTKQPYFDLSLAPQELKTTLQGIQEQDIDPEEKFYKILSFALPYNDCYCELPINSFSIQQMKDLQIEQAMETLAKTLNSGKNSRQTKGKSKKQTTLASSTTPEGTTLSSTICNGESLVTLMDNHQGPKPRPLPNSFDLPEFPVEIEELLLNTIENCEFQPYNYYQQGNILLFWLLYRLQPFNMQFSHRVTNKLLQVHTNPPFNPIWLLEGCCLITRYWMQELIIRVGGTNFRYTLNNIERKIIASSNKEFQDKTKTTDAILAAVENAFALHQAHALIEAQDSAHNLNSDICSNLSSSAPIELDYDTLLKNLPQNAATELFSLLRWKNPTQARLMLPARLKRIKKDENIIAFLKLMRINLSLDDEPFLIQLLQESVSDNIKQTVRELLYNMASPQYSDLCKAYCLKIAQFDGQEWKFQATAKFNDTLKSLGIPIDNNNNTIDNHAIRDLFQGLTWEDLKEVAHAQTTEQALNAYSSDSFCQVVDYVSIMETIGLTISRSNEQQALATYIDFTGLDQNVNSTCEDSNDKMRLIANWFNFSTPLIMKMDIDQRCAFLNQKQAYNIDSSYFLEDKSNPLDFNFLDEQWCRCIILNYLRHEAGNNFKDWTSYFAMFAPPSVKPFLLQCRTVLEQGVPELRKLSSYIKDGLFKYDVKIDTREYLKACFEFNLELRDKLMAKFTPLIDKLNTFPEPRHHKHKRNNCPTRESKLLSNSLNRFNNSIQNINKILQLIEKREHIDKVIDQVLKHTNHN